MRGDISRDLSPNDLIGFSTNLRCLLWFLLDSARTALTGGRHAESAAVRFLPNTALSRVCGIAARLRHRRLCFATWITWIGRSSTAIGQKWRSSRRALDNRDPALCICYVGRCLSCRTRPPPSPPRYIPSPTHYTGLGTHVSAGFFSPTDSVASAASSGCLMGRGCAPFTCGTWCLRSGVWNGRWHGCLTACERVYGSLCTCTGSPLWPMGVGGKHGFEFGGWELEFGAPQGCSMLKIGRREPTLPDSKRFLINKRCAGNLPPEVQWKWVRVTILGTVAGFLCGRPECGQPISAMAP